MSLRSALLVLVVSGSTAVSGGERTLRVRASEATAPCVEAAAIQWRSGGIRVAVHRGPLTKDAGLDLYVGSSVEMTRAIETGAAREGSEIDVARIPWVLTVPAGNPERLTSLGDAAKRGHEVATLSGPEAYEARRSLQAAVRADRIREMSDGQGLEKVAVALVPLSLARGEHVLVDVPPLVARAAAAEGAPRGAWTKSFLQFLGSPEGKAAFATCRP